MTEKTAYEIQVELNQRIVNEFVLDKFTALIGALRFFKRIGLTDEELVETITELLPQVKTDPTELTFIDGAKFGVNKSQGSK